jgi:leader peptidase (prepilin peptidase) / N-methyltransferase
MRVPTLADLPPPLIVGLAVSLGLLFGSFLNVVIHRLPREQSVVSPGSRCPACGTPIRAYDNIPVVSWVFLRGKSRCCKAKISARYPLVELLGGLFAWALVETVVAELQPETAWWRVLLVFALYLALGLGLIALAFIDLEHMLLPDEITLGGVLLGVLSVPLRPEATWLGALGGAVFGFLLVWLPFDLLYRVLRGQPGMGLGDAKLVMLAGAWFGWPGAVFTLMAGAVQGTFGAIVVFLTRGQIEEPEAVRAERAEMLRHLETLEGEERRAFEEELAKDPVMKEPEPGLAKARLPFGPFLALSALEFLLFGKVLVRDYLQWLWPGF